MNYRQILSKIEQTGTEQTKINIGSPIIAINKSPLPVFFSRNGYKFRPFGSLFVLHSKQKINILGRQILRTCSLANITYCQDIVISPIQICSVRKNITYCQDLVISPIQICSVRKTLQYILMFQHLHQSYFITSGHITG